MSRLLLLLCLPVLVLTLSASSALAAPQATLGFTFQVQGKGKSEAAARSQVSAWAADDTAYFLYLLEEASAATGLPAGSYAPVCHVTASPSAGGGWKASAQVYIAPSFSFLQGDGSEVDVDTDMLLQLLQDDQDAIDDSFLDMDLEVLEDIVDDMNSGPIGPSDEENEDWIADQIEEFLDTLAYLDAFFDAFGDLFD